MKLMVSMGHFPIDLLLALCSGRTPALQTLFFIGPIYKHVSSHQVSIQRRPHHKSQGSVLVGSVTLTCREQYLVADIWDKAREFVFTHFRALYNSHLLDLWQWSVVVLPSHKQMQPSSKSILCAFKRKASCMYHIKGLYNFSSCILCWW